MISKQDCPLASVNNEIRSRMGPLTAADHLSGIVTDPRGGIEAGSVTGDKHPFSVHPQPTPTIRTGLFERFLILTSNTVF